MSVKVIIFDFDGTIADTLDAIVRITNRLAVEFGYKPTTPEELEQVRKISSRQIIKLSGLSIFKIPFLLKRLKTDLRQEIEQLNTITGIKETLENLKNDGKIIGILTSNSEENVSIFLKKHDMQNLFDFIDSGTTLFGKHKILKKWIKKNKFKPENIIYVGDETRDIESAQKINIKIVAVTWGFNSSEALAECNPDFLIDHPRELIELMKHL
ncbi:MULTISPECIES: HAD-IA family hydrolase [unclassified Coleofasciculus]|uniref:HAD-IA family hydrolase n=1 Tax=unclassified Coleofasciculus TaxID=2692782 RepID=UPI00188257FC|nr:MULTISPECIES: HAD-IA family hydrolase [unclassified Coleofasciculus]MBE9128437.1 HAD-IA family hydrolase [Coleofasciculus sp. LEGE 07081]MBE9149406.1 HAD-IA family hydrolase [Coleofasciculus sp. LEGE 07092]